MSSASTNQPPGSLSMISTRSATCPQRSPLASTITTDEYAAALAATSPSTACWASHRGATLTPRYRSRTSRVARTVRRVRDALARLEADGAICRARRGRATRVGNVCAAYLLPRLALVLFKVARAARKVVTTPSERVRSGSPACAGIDPAECGGAAQAGG